MQMSILEAGTSQTWIAQFSMDDHKIDPIGYLLTNI